MRPAPSRIWHAAAARIARADSFSAFTEHQQRVLDYLWESYSGLYLGAPNEVHTKETILKISRDLSSSVSTAGKRERFDFLARGFEQGNLSLHGWDVPLGPVYVKINREENFCRQDRFRPLGQAEKFIEAFRLSLETAEFTDRQVLLGQILVSAVIFGGLLDRTWLAPFQESILKRHYYQEGPIFWVDMAAVEAGPRLDRPERRLVPDHLTRLLIYRYHRLVATGSRPTVAHDPWQSITAFMKSAAFPGSVQPRSVTELFTWAMARYLTVLPHSLVAYAAGKLAAVSLPTAPWLRTLSGMAIPVAGASTEKSAEFGRIKPQIAINEQTKKSRQQQLLSDLLKTLRFSKKTAKTLRRHLSLSGTGLRKMSPQRARRFISAFLKQQRPQMSAALQLLLHWALRLLAEKVSPLERRQKKSIRPASVDRYLLSMGYALLNVAGNLPLHDLEPQELEAVYEQVALRLGKNDYAMLRLRQFHGFLQVFNGAHDMEWGDLLGLEGKPHSAVNANLVTPRIYLAALRSLGWGEGGLTRWQTLHVITLILLFRCGLRPSELQALRLKDVQGITRYEILIRNSRLNTIKTNSGIRRLPFSDMLLKDELDFFLAYCRMRQDEDRHVGGELLLTHPLHFGGPLSDEELFEPIRKLLRSITRDESLRLYHLRHSMLTWANTILQLDPARSEIELATIAPPLAEIGLISNLFRYLSGNEATGRKDHYLLAMLAGHASPETTQHHYCHLDDLVLGHHLNSPENCLPINHRMSMALTGLQRSAAYELLNTPEHVHPLHNVTANEAPKVSRELRHPLMATALPLKEAKESFAKATKLPPWEEAIGSLDNRKLVRLRRSKNDWDFAAEIYETVRAFDGRKIKTARKVVSYVREYYSQRYGGISFILESKTRSLVQFLSENGMPEMHMIAIFHAAKKLTLVEVEESIKGWAHVLGLNPSQISTGEKVPTKMRIKSRVTVKITTHKNAIKKVRAPKMSLGFLVAMELLYQYLT